MDRFSSKRQRAIFLCGILDLLQTAAAAVSYHTTTTFEKAENDVRVYPPTYKLATPKLGPSIYTAVPEFISKIRYYSVLL